MTEPQSRCASYILIAQYLGNIDRYLCSNAFKEIWENHQSLQLGGEHALPKLSLLPNHKISLMLSCDGNDSNYNQGWVMHLFACINAH